jgi:hypothetical protein
LFDKLDEDEDGIPDAKFGKRFAVQITGVIDEFVEDDPKGIFVEIDNQGNEVYKGILNVESKAIITFTVLRKA